MNDKYVYVPDGNEAGIEKASAWDRYVAFTNKRLSTIKYVIWFAAMVVFWLICGNLPNTPDQTAFYMTLIASLTFLYFAGSDKITSIPQLLFVIGAVAALLLLRASLFYCETQDYRACLRPWVVELSKYDGFSGLTAKIGDYNMPYLYLVFIIAKLNLSPLAAYKAFSVVFDVILAYYTMKIVSLKTENMNSKIAAFLIVLAAPTVVINGAFWGQCDSVYAALAVAAVYYGLIGKSKTAWVMFALSFSFKLQAVFIFPVMLYLCAIKKVKVVDLFIAAVTFCVTLLPAILAGRSVYESFVIYIDQTKSYVGRFTLNAANVWHLIDVNQVIYDNFSKAAIFFTGFCVLCLLYFTWTTRRKQVKIGTIINVAFVFVVIIPMFLPKMHERYFFLADCLAILVFLYNKKRWYIPVIVSFSSWCSYWIYLFGKELIDFKYLSIAMLVALAIVLKDVVTVLTGDDEQAAKKGALTAKSIEVRVAHAPRKMSRRRANN